MSLTEDQLSSRQYNWAESIHNDLKQRYRIKLFPSHSWFWQQKLSLSVSIGLPFPQVLHCELSTRSHFAWLELLLALTSISSSSIIFLLKTSNAVARIQHKWLCFKTTAKSGDTENNRLAYHLELNTAVRTIFFCFWTFSRLALFPLATPAASL